MGITGGFLAASTPLPGWAGQYGPAARTTASGSVEYLRPSSLLKKGTSRSMTTRTDRVPARTAVAVYADAKLTTCSFRAGSRDASDTYLCTKSVIQKTGSTVRTVITIDQLDVAGSRVCSRTTDSQTRVIGVSRHHMSINASATAAFRAGCGNTFRVRAVTSVVGGTAAAYHVPNELLLVLPTR